jgi:hypothetical protein
VNDDGRKKGAPSFGALTPLPLMQPPVSRAAGNRVMSRVMRDATTTLSGFVDAKKEKTWKIGSDEFTDGAYQQLLRWLSAIQSSNGPRTIDALVKLLEVPFGSSWIIDGHIEAIVLRSLAMSKFDLNNVPDLNYLDCSSNQLDELDLSRVPRLASLWCAGNWLTKLDLSSVPGLTELNCGGSSLTELDLSGVPKLAVLYCAGNGLTAVDLSNVPELVELFCGWNRLTRLNLSNVPGLTFLQCSGNALTALDIRPCHSLKRVICDPWVVVDKRPDQTVRHSL